MHKDQAKVDHQKVRKLLLDMRNLAQNRNFTIGEDITAACDYLQCMCLALNSAGKNEEVVKNLLQELAKDTLKKMRSGEYTKEKLLFANIKKSTDSGNVRIKVRNEGNCKKVVCAIKVGPHTNPEDILKSIAEQSNEEIPAEVRKEIYRICRESKIVEKIFEEDEDDLFDDELDDDLFNDDNKKEAKNGEISKTIH